MQRERSEQERYHDARHEAAHVVAALHYHLPVAYATLTNSGGACRLGTTQPSYQDEIQYVVDHARDYAVIFMAGTAYERLAGTLPLRIVILTEADRVCAREYLQKQLNEDDRYSQQITDILEESVEIANNILANNIHLWNALTDALFERHNLRWEEIREIAINTIANLP